MRTEALLRLAGAVRGSVVSAADAAYDESRRVWNGTIDKHPELIVSCVDTADVVEAIRYARTHDLGVSVRSGGHHVAGSAVIDAGLVIDLGGLREVSVDGGTARVHASGGALIGDVDRATQEHGLAVPLGLVSETGVAGLTLAGGYGWMRRKHGLSCDNVLAAEVVTADGQVLTVSPQEHPDLFWALRGGGWDLGVVTALDYQAHPVGPDVHLAFLTFGVAEAHQVLANLTELVRGAPRGFAPLAVFWTFPEADVFPEELWGQPFLGVAGPYVGAVAEGERVCAALRDLGTVLTDLSGVVPWVEAQQFFDEDYPRGRRYYWKSSHLASLEPEAVTALTALAASRPSPLTSLDVWINGGAIADVPDADSPVGNRSAPYMVGIEANWDDPAQDRANIEWARAASAVLEPFSSPGAYLNFDDLGDPETFRRAHGDSYERLAGVKQAYDPTNLFRSRTGPVG
ncbi:MAG TPA: FAD-binding oxidoreductase [Propionicimonas sp.]|uniref:FAD-binding oxidoreductase n=1 Tax=Propionicimonas sp. TaxID=1955623 RepID=UPI002F3ECE31